MGARGTVNLLDQYTLTRFSGGGAPFRTALRRTIHRRTPVLQMYSVLYAVPFFSAKSILVYTFTMARGQGAEPSQNLADQLTLFKPGGQIMPLTLLPAPPDSKSFLHLYLPSTYLHSMALPVVEISRQGYKIGKVFA